MRPVVVSITGQTSSNTSIAAATTLGAAGNIPQNGALATANSVALSQTTAGAGALILNGARSTANVAQFVTPSRLNFTSTGNLSAVNFTIVGTVAQGPDTTGNIAGPQTEVIAGPNNSTVVSQNTWLRIYSITASAAVGTAVTVYGTALLPFATQGTITSANDQTAVNFTFFGFNANGQPYTETITGPGAGLTTATVGFFSAITQVTSSAATSAASVGNSGSVVSPWVVVDYFEAPFDIGVQCVLTGSANYGVQVTLDDVFGGIPYRTTNLTALPAPAANLATATTSQVGAITAPCRAVRLNITSGVGSLAMTVVQGLNT